MEFSEVGDKSNFRHSSPSMFEIILLTPVSTLNARKKNVIYNTLQKVISILFIHLVVCPLIANNCILNKSVFFTDIIVLAI